jgi:GTPase
LGDRIRMQEHFNDEGVFIRSMASRGEFGGITFATRGALTVLDAMGKDYILVETVGVGQDEIDIARVADTTVIVLAPGLGDTIQTLKAGILEVGDILVVNKADKPDANVAIAELKAMVALGISTNPGPEDWQPMVVSAIANSSQGISELWSAIEMHQAYLSREPSPNYKKRRFYFHKLELVDLVKKQFIENILKDLNQKGRLDDYVAAIIKKEIDPYTASEQILAYLSKES